MDRDEILNEHLASLFRFAWALTGDDAAAVELTHQALADDSWQHARPGIRAVEMALFTAAFRSFTRGQTMPVPPVHGRIAAIDELSWQHASNLSVAALLRSFRELELPQRAALVLFYTTHCSLHDIAAVLHRSDDETVAIISRGKVECLHILQREAGGEKPTEGGVS